MGQRLGTPISGNLINCTGYVVSIGTGLVTAGGTTSVSLTSATNTLGADVALNNIANYFTGPTVAQGTSGTWFASGTVTFQDTAGAANFRLKLWDGTTVIASAFQRTDTASATYTVSLSGVLAAPAGNIRISVRDATSTSGKILFNSTGESMDSTLTCIRIA